MHEPDLCGFGGGPEPATESVNDRDSSPCARQTEIVREVLEDFDRSLCGLEQLALGFRMRNAEPPRSLEEPVPALPPIAGLTGRFDEPVEERLGPGKFPD